MPKIVSVYFNATNDGTYIPPSGHVPFAALLNRLTYQDHVQYFSLGINGCGVNNKSRRDFGFIFGCNLVKQVKEVTASIEKILHTDEQKVILNLFGFSRGGIAAFLLTKNLAKYPLTKLKINLVVVDPVPGNALATVYADLFFHTQSTLTVNATDLTGSQNLSNVLLLYTNMPLPDITCHAPLLPICPEQTEVELDVMPGCHRQVVAFNKNGAHISACNDESALIFHRVIEFMQRNRTKFDFKSNSFQANLIYSPDGISSADRERLLSLYENMCRKEIYINNPEVRSMHWQNAISTVANRRYLNRYHQQLNNAAVITDAHITFIISDRNLVYMTPGLKATIELANVVFLLAILMILYNKFNTRDNELPRDFNLNV